MIIAANAYFGEKEMSLPPTYFIRRPIKLNTDNSPTTRVTLKLIFDWKKTLKYKNWVPYTAPAPWLMH
jgi:hypothetical protein